MARFDVTNLTPFSINKVPFYIAVLLGTVLLASLLYAAPWRQSEQHGKTMKTESAEGLAKVTLGAGCFWCVEAVFERLDGVRSVEAGYAGGTAVNPTYEQVCTGRTGHAEVAQIQYDPKKITFEKILDVFWEAHDPTTLNQQGADHGTQYRSVIFYNNEAERKIAEESKARAQKMFNDPIVTEIEPLTTFYIAENYHQDYYNSNSSAPYCRFVIKPKLEKLGLDKK